MWNKQASATLPSQRGANEKVVEFKELKMEFIYLNLLIIWQRYKEYYY